MKKIAIKCSITGCAITKLQLHRYTLSEGFFYV